MTFPPPPDQGGMIIWEEPTEQLQLPPDFECGGDLQSALGVLSSFRERLEGLAADSNGTTWLHLRFHEDAKYANVMHAWDHAD